MQKFPLRMKDNDLLVTELYHDPSNDAITALSVYLTPKTSQYTAGYYKFLTFFEGCIFIHEFTLWLDKAGAVHSEN